ncbi:Co2+/Mg2+ efflux protein ApaG [Pseudomonas sp. F1_0610]|uniref:Co2+/Mg2+ efflux protein ApaG n=1 Tax=Pseudomonas sp. F1_0610 TaxID=3114284 RepID=UPI0039C32359
MSDPRYQIDVQVKTRFLPDHSEPQEQRFVFAYDITIVNNGSISAQLLSRHWLITNSNGQTQEVRGDGVVGEQPHIQPNKSFSYSSGTILATEVGSMQGSFTMQAEDGYQFDAPIAPFSLAIPGIMH